VIVSAPDGTGQRPITVNGFQALHQQPVWSPDGSRLAFVESTADGSFVVVVERDAEAKRLPAASAPFYLQWDDAGSRIAVLRNDPDTVFAVDVASVTGPEGFATVGGGAPLYVDWEPAQGRLAVHASNAEVGVSDGQGAAAALEVDTGPYSVPHWTLGGISHIATVGDEFQLRLVEPGGSAVALVSMASTTQIVASPTGRRLAVYVPPVGEQPRGLGVAEPAVPIVEWSSFVVVDVATGEITDVAEGELLAFFWSPDGSKILFFDLDLDGRGPSWKVWDAVAGEVSAYPSLRLGDQFVEQILPFFEQYALSMQLWAPDSSAFAYPAQVGGGAAIFVQDLDGGAPQLVSDGTWVSWSPA
jgi:TolB protein